MSVKVNFKSYLKKKKARFIVGFDLNEVKYNSQTVQAHTLSLYSHCIIMYTFQCRVSQ